MNVSNKGLSSQSTRKSQKRSLEEIVSTNAADAAIEAAIRPSSHSEPNIPINVSDSFQSDFNIQNSNGNNPSTITSNANSISSACNDELQSNEKKYRKKSSIWDEVIAVQDEEGRNRVLCLRCKNILHFSYGTKVERLRKHFVSFFFFF